MTDSNDSKLSKIDQAIAAAKARKAAKENSEVPSLTADALEELAYKVKAASAKKATSTVDAVRAAKQEKLEAERAARKAAKEAERAKKKAEKDAVVKPSAHMSKVMKAAEKLPALSKIAHVAFQDAVNTLSADEITALSLHLQFHNRVAATEAATKVKVKEGSRVRVVGGNPKFVGLQGVVTRAQRIRCFVQLDSESASNKELYLFTSEVQVLAGEMAVVDDNEDVEVESSETDDSTSEQDSTSEGEPEQEQLLTGTDG